MTRFAVASALVASTVVLVSVAHAAPVQAVAPDRFATTLVAYNGDPYSSHPRGGGRRAHASKKTPEPPADISKGETADQHKAYLKKYGF